MNEHRHPSPAAETVDDLEAAASEYRAAREAVDVHGEAALEDVQEALTRARGLLAEFEDTATETGAREFVDFARFKQAFTGHVQGLDDDLPGRDAFEAALEAVDKRRLHERDFERARSALEPAAALLDRLDDLETARDRLDDRRTAARQRRQELQAAVEEHERVLELGEADLDAPIEELREPIGRWNDAVEAAIDDLRTDAPARDAFALLARARQFPLVALPEPSTTLQEYVATTPAGEESVTRLLEYADFSRSKLDHYVDDPTRFRRTVGTERSVLEELTAEPLSVAWPPPPAETVPWRTRALLRVAGGMVDEPAVGALRDLDRTARDREYYDRLRTAAVATTELASADRRRLEDGTVETELDALRAGIERIDETLASVPDP